MIEHKLRQTTYSQENNEVYFQNNSHQFIRWNSDRLFDIALEKCKSPRTIIIRLKGLFFLTIGTAHMIKVDVKEATTDA